MDKSLVLIIFLMLLIFLNPSSALSADEDQFLTDRFIKEQLNNLNWY